MSLRPIPDISVIDVAFPARAMEWLPAWTEIPEELRNPNARSKWHRLFNDAFFFGLSDLALVPKEGVDPQKAWSVIRACMGSFAPKHEHKESGVAFLLSEWFSDAMWTRKSMAKPADPAV
jgi:hypothetical protein